MFVSECQISQMSFFPSLWYLGIELSKKLVYGTHIRAAAAKEGKTANALEKILPNVRGARQGKRNVLALVVQNQLLYGAPIWTGSLTFENSVNTLLDSQRKMALRTAMVYRTVLTSAIMVFAGIIPVQLMAKERQETYRRVKNGLEAIKEELWAHIYRGWQKEWDQGKNGR